MRVSLLEIGSVISFLPQTRQPRPFFSQRLSQLQAWSNHEPSFPTHSLAWMYIGTWACSLALQSLGAAQQRWRAAAGAQLALSYLSEVPNAARDMLVSKQWYFQPRWFCCCWREWWEAPDSGGAGSGVQTDDWVTATPPLAACQARAGSGGSRSEPGCWCCYQTSAIWSTHLRGCGRSRAQRLICSSVGFCDDTVFSPGAFKPGQHLRGCYSGWSQINYKVGLDRNKPSLCWEKSSS